MLTLLKKVTQQKKNQTIYMNPTDDIWIGTTEPTNGEKFWIDGDLNVTGHVTVSTVEPAEGYVWLEVESVPATVDEVYVGDFYVE
jgi:hypothetical protein